LNVCRSSNYRILTATLLASLKWRTNQLLLLLQQHVRGINEQRDPHYFDESLLVVSAFFFCKKESDFLLVLEEQRSYMTDLSSSNTGDSRVSF
jgi:hypothetical protein